MGRDGGIAATGAVEGPLAGMTASVVRAMLQRPECEEGHTMGPSPGPEHEIVQGSDDENDEDRDGKGQARIVDEWRAELVRCVGLPDRHAELLTDVVDRHAVAVLVARGCTPTARPGGRSMSRIVASCNGRVAVAGQG